MSNDVEIVTGDDIVLVHPISTDFIAPNIPASAIVTCSIVSSDKSINYTGEITQIATQEKADWAKGNVSVIMTSTQTAAITALVTKWNRGRVLAYMETQINDAGKRDTHFAKLIIVRGNVA